MSIRIETLAVDARDPAAQAAWWAEALGWRITEQEDDEVVVAPDDRSGHRVSELLFLRVPEGKEVKNRLHLDLRPDDQDTEVVRFEGLGARRVDVGQSDDVTWVVLADPEGNEFCILRAATPDASP